MTDRIDVGLLPFVKNVSPNAYVWIIDRDDPLRMTVADLLALAKPVDKTSLGLSNVDNTKDSSKPVSEPQQRALDAKADKGHAHSAESIDGLDEKILSVLGSCGARAFLEEKIEDLLSPGHRLNVLIGEIVRLNLIRMLREYEHRTERMVNNMSVNVETALSEIEVVKDDLAGKVDNVSLTSIIDSEIEKKDDVFVLPHLW